MTALEITSLIINVLQIVALFALFRNYYSASRAEKINYFYNRNDYFYANEKIRGLMFRLENDQLPLDFFKEKELYESVLIALAYFNSICYMHRTKKTKTDEFIYFCVEMHNLVTNNSVEAYLNTLLDKSIITFLKHKTIPDIKLHSYDYLDEFLPYLSLQVYVCKETYGYSYKQAYTFLNNKCKERYAKLSNF